MSLLSIFFSRPPNTIERFATYEDLHDYYNNLMKSLYDLQADCGFNYLDYFLHVEKQIKQRRIAAEKAFDRNVPSPYDVWITKPKENINAVKTQTTPSESEVKTAVAVIAEKMPAQEPPASAPVYEFIDPVKLENEERKNG